MNNARTESSSRAAAASSTSTNHRNVHGRSYSNSHTERHPSDRRNHQHGRNYDNRPSMHHGNHRAPPRSNYHGRDTQRGRDDRRGHNHYPRRDGGLRRDGGAQPRRNDGHQYRRDGRDPAIDDLRREYEIINEQARVEQAKRQLLEEKLRNKEMERQLETVTSPTTESAANGEDSPAPALAQAPALTMNSPANAGAADLDDENLFGDSPASYEPTNNQSILCSQGDNDLVDSDDGFKPKAGAKRRKIARKKASKSSRKRTKKKKAEEEVVVEQEEGNKDYVYSEKDLMTTYTPEIKDHSMAAKKLLVQWNKSDCSISGSLCRNWIGFDDFVFPGLAEDYFEKLIGSGGSKDNQKSLSDWRQFFYNRAVEETLSSTIKDLNIEEGPDLEEIDFCCFMCRCKCTDDVMKRNLHNCEAGRKFHRVCCHGYCNLEDLDGFSSAAGQALLGLIPVEEDDTEIEAVSLDEPIKSTAVRVCNGKDCADLNNVRGVSVVLSINTGIGGVAVALKQLGMNTTRIIHVDDDPVIQHVIRYNHDLRYGETTVDDGIEHVIGLYNDLNELMVDPADIITRWGAIGES